MVGGGLEGRRACSCAVIFFALCSLKGKEGGVLFPDRDFHQGKPPHPRPHGVTPLSCPPRWQLDFYLQPRPGKRIEEVSGSGSSAVGNATPLPTVKIPPFRLARE